MANTPPEQDPNNKIFSATDIFGFGKIVEKIPLQKINALMAFCLTGVIIFLSAAIYLYLNKEPSAEFPTDWDMRILFIICFIIVFIAIINYIKGKK